VVLTNEEQLPDQVPPVYCEGCPYQLVHAKGDLDEKVLSSRVYTSLPGRHMQPRRANNSNTNQDGAASAGQPWTVAMGDFPPRILLDQMYQSGSILAPAPGSQPPPASEVRDTAAKVVKKSPHPDDPDSAKLSTDEDIANRLLFPERVECAYEKGLRQLYGDAKEDRGLFWVRPKRSAMRRTEAQQCLTSKNVTVGAVDHIQPHYPIATENPGVTESASSTVSLGDLRIQHVAQWQHDNSMGPEALESAHQSFSFDISEMTSHLEIRVKHEVPSSGRQRTIGHAFIDTRQSFSGWEELYCPIIWDSHRHEEGTLMEAHALCTMQDGLVHVWDSHHIDKGVPLPGWGHSHRPSQEEDDFSQEAMQDVHLPPQVETPICLREQIYRQSAAGLIDCLQAQGRIDEVARLKHKLKSLQRREQHEVRRLLKHATEHEENSDNPMGTSFDVGSKLPAAFVVDREQSVTSIKGWIKLRVHKIAIIEDHSNALVQGKDSYKEDGSTDDFTCDDFTGDLDGTISVHIADDEALQASDVTVNSLVQVADATITANPSRQEPGLLNKQVDKQVPSSSSRPCGLPRSGRGCRPIW